MEEILSRLLQPDNQVIKEATTELNKAFRQPGVIPELCRVLTSSPSPQIRQYAAVLLRKKFYKSKHWKKFSKEDQALLKNGCLSSLESEKEKIVVAALVQLVAAIARHELASGWPELFQFIQTKLSSNAGPERALGSNTIAVLAQVVGDKLKPMLKDFLLQFRKTLQDPEEEVCYQTIVALTHFVRITGSDEANLFQQLIPVILQKVQQLVKSNQEKATSAIDIFDELIECEVGMVIPHIKPIVELCIALAGETSLDDPLRIKAITFLGRLTRLKKKTIIKHKLYIPMINVLFDVMCSQEVEDDDDEDADDEDDSPSLAASQALDILALHLPPEKYLTNLLAKAQPALKSDNPVHHRAAYQAIAVSAEGCQEHIRSKYLSHFLQQMGSGIRHPNQLVRNAALYMLGQFSEYIQPDISNYASEILPVLFEYLDAAFATFQPGVKESSSVSRIFYALDSFCENLEEKLVPHLESIMQRALASLNPNFSVRVRELGMSLIGSTANAVESAIVPYFDAVYQHLHTYLTMEHNDDTQVLLTQSMQTLSILARCVGKEQFKVEFAEECIKIAMSLVEKNDDPDVRKCAYSLFGAVATIVKEDMATVMETCVTLMLKTIQSTEGISFHLNGDEESNLPLEHLEESDEEEEISLEDSVEKAVEDLEEVKGISVENAYVAEKECAIKALKDLSVECGQAFYPYINQSMVEVLTMIEYPEEDVKSAALNTAAFFLIAYYKSGTAEGLAAFKSGLDQLLPKLLEMVVDEPEHSVVVSALDAITELLKECKTGVTEVDGNPNKIAGVVQKIMKKECACQDQDDDEAGLEEDEEEEAEQDEMLFQYAGEVLPNLGRAMNPESFSPYFTGLFPQLLKKTKRQCTVAERSFAIGALADCMEPLQGKLEPYLKHLLPVFIDGFKDDECDVRNNAVYGIGELVLWGGDAVAPHYSNILSALSNLLNHEQAPRVVDQIVAAVCRFIVSHLNAVPLESLLPVLLHHLPLKEDPDEYEMVFKAFTCLYTADPAQTMQQCLPKILESIVGFYAMKDANKEKVGPLAVQLIKQISNDYPAELTSLLSSLPQDTANSLANLIKS